MSEQNKNEPLQIGLDLKNADLETLEVFIQETSDDDVFEDILRENNHREEVVKMLYMSANTPQKVRNIAASALNLPPINEEELKEIKRREAEQRARDIQKERLVKKIAKMTVSQKIKLAIKGGSEVRGILIKDSNKLVVANVLDNPRITDSEILNLAKNRSTTEDTIRTIGNNREWMKSYSIQHAIVSHPKTPPAIAMKLLAGIKKKDIKLLEKNKNVSEAVRTLAKKYAKGTSE